MVRQPVDDATRVEDMSTRQAGDLIIEAVVVQANTTFSIIWID
jgi:hypothetical protein